MVTRVKLGMGSENGNFGITSFELRKQPEECYYKTIYELFVDNLLTPIPVTLNRWSYRLKFDGGTVET